ILFLFGIWIRLYHENHIYILQFQAHFSPLFIPPSGIFVHFPSLDWTPFSNAFQAKVAHLILAGNLETPCKAMISPNSSSMSTSFPIIISENVRDISMACSTDFPLIASVIMDAE